MASHRRLPRRGKSVPATVLLTIDHHAVIHSCVFTLEGRVVFCPLAFTETCNGSRSRAVGNAGTGADGLSHSRPHSRRTEGSLNRLLIALYQPLLNTVLLSERAHWFLLFWWPSPARGQRPNWAANSCRRWTKAICSTCRRRARYPPEKLVNSCSRRIVSSKTVPEVARVFGKAGHAESQRRIRRRWRCWRPPFRFKPREQWRPGMTPDKLVELVVSSKLRDSPTSGYRRSATELTCWPPASRAGRRESGRHQSGVD